MHWLVVVLLVSMLALPPLLANLPAWLVALCVSYAGHRGLTFRGSGAGTATSAPRFFVVSACGFAINEASYAWALQLGGWRYDAVLAAVLLAVAVLTYLASRHWAFAARPGRPGPTPGAAAADATAPRRDR